MRARRPIQPVILVGTRDADELALDQVHFFAAPANDVYAAAQAA